MATIVTRFAHLHTQPDRMDIYCLPGPDVPDTVLLPRRPGVTTLMQAADQLLHEHGWKLGADGWRRPLDPATGIIATCHLIPIGQPR